MPSPLDAPTAPFSSRAIKILSLACKTGVPKSYLKSMNDTKHSFRSSQTNISTSLALSPSRALPGLLLSATLLLGTLSEGASTLKAGSPAHQNASTAGLKPGDLLFTDSQAAVLRVDGATGQVSPLATGGMLVQPCGIAVGPDETIYVTDTGCLAVMAIDPSTGEATMLSSGGLLGVPFGMAINDQGEIFVANSQAIVGIDPATGTQRTVSSGGAFRAPVGVAVAPSGELYVADATGLVIRVDPVSGDQMIVSSGQNLITPLGIIVQDQKTIYVSDSGAHAIIHVDPRTGAQKVISAQGSLATPFGLALFGKHELVVGDPDAFDLAGGIIHIDLHSGAQSPMMTGSGNFVNARCVAVVPGSPN